MSAEDEIRNLLSTYCYCLDGRKSEEYISLFTRDCKMWTRLAAREGLAGIRDHITDVYTAWPATLRTKHSLGGSVIHVNGDTAEAETTVIVYKSLDNGPWELGQVGRYLDKFKIEDGKWRFFERRIEADGSLRDPVK